MRPLLVLRPEPGATATLARAAALGLDAVAAPLFAVRPLAWTPPDPAVHDAVMLTSAQAPARAGPALARYRGLPAYAVGATTAAAARAAGFATIHAGERDATALLARMAADGIARPLHLAGREHRAAGHPALAITRVAVYATETVSALPPAAREALARGAVALVHSPRAAALLARLIQSSAPPTASNPDPWREDDDPFSARATIPLAAISPAAAAAAGDGWSAVAVAAMPTDAALLAAAAGLCD